MKVVLRLYPVPLLDICLALVDDIHKTSLPHKSQEALKEKFMEPLSPRAGGDRGDTTVAVELDYAEYLQCLQTVKRVLSSPRHSDTAKKRLRESTACFFEKELLVAVANADGCELVTLP